jgi:hypothetical protein
MTKTYLGGRLKPDFIARLKYKTTEEGGRKGPAKSRYRPLVEFPGLEPLTSGEQIFIDKEIVNPGDTVKAEMTILSVQAFEGKLYVGEPFRFWESQTEHSGREKYLK